MEKIRFCKTCGKVLILDKEHHKVVRDETETGLCTIGRQHEPIYYDAFDCEYCGCQTVIGERKREVYEICFKEVEEPQDENTLSLNCEEQINEDDIADIQKKIEEAGE